MSDIEKITKEELDKLLKLIDIDTEYNIETKKVDDIDYVFVSFNGENLGYLIGNHGRHLDSLQYVLQLILRSKLRAKEGHDDEDEKEEDEFRVVLDVCDYRKDRNEKLEKFAMQKADDARILGEAVDLPPMKPSDRRVVHVVLQKFDDIKTESIGEDRERHIRIIPSSDAEFNKKEEADEESEE